MKTIDNNTIRLGVDLGGTKIEVAALSADGRMLLRRRTPTPGGDYEATVRAVASLVCAVEQELGIGQAAPTGICSPGSLSPTTGLIRNANSVCLNGQPLRDDLQIALDRPVRLANDADCLALSEARDGAAQGAGIVFGVILGTGVGGGVVVRGQLLQGANGITGEWGHIPMSYIEAAQARTCWCGRRDCVERYLSGPALEREYRALGGVEGLRVPEIAGLADQGDTLATAVLEQYEDRLARSLATIIDVLDPNIIVLGGGVSNLERLYLTVPRLWGAHVFSDSVSTVLRPARFGDSSGVRGAAWLWPLSGEASTADAFA